MFSGVGLLVSSALMGVWALVGFWVLFARVLLPMVGVFGVCELTV